MVAALEALVLSMRFLLVIAAIVGLLWTASRARKHQLPIWASFAWSLLWIAVGTVAFIPEFANRLADVLGVGRGADVVVYSAIVVIIALLFRMSVRIEQLDRAITTVTRELALRDREQKR